MSKKVRYTGAANVVRMSSTDWSAAGVDAKEEDAFELQVTKKGERVVELSDAAAERITQPGNDFVYDSEADQVEDVYAEDADV